METVQNALYLFCFAHSNLVGELEGVGIDSRHPLSVFRCLPNLAAVVSAARREEFCGSPAELSTRDPAWVGWRASLHEAVVQEVMRHSPVLPAPFGTLFSSQERLAGFLETHRATISQFLERVADQEEWSVRGLLDRRQAEQALTSASLAAQEAQLATLPAEARYFLEQSIQQASESELSHWLDETYREVASDLMKPAADFRECQVAPHERLESDIEVVLDCALLLPRGARAAFRSRIDQLNANHASKGLVLELSGPRPPYRFVPPLPMGVAP